MDIKQKLIRAIENNEVIEFLEGKGQYKIEFHQWVSSNAPTDITQIMTQGIYKLYIERPEMNIDKVIENKLLQMMDLNEFDIYIALQIIYFQLIREQRGDSPFRLDMKKLLKKSREALTKNKQKMKEYKEWGGAGKENGLWDDVVRIDNLCKRKWNISIL
ncbi:MAG: hypothetical protein GX359_12495 [Clostridiales bacterium]|nr:hypothetical protein [Clostridiales bacterium]